MSDEHPGWGGRRAGAGRKTRSLADVVGARRDGTKVTVLDRAVETYRLGGFTADVAARCGVARETLHEWERTGTKAITDVTAGRRHRSALTAHEKKCAEFVMAVEQAVADGKVLLLGLAQKLAAGDFQVTHTTEKVDARGNTVERTTRTETILPSESMIRWTLATRWPDQFAQRVQVTGADGTPLLDLSPVDRLLGELDRIAHQHAETDPLITQNGNGNGHNRPTTTVP